MSICTSEHLSGYAYYWLPFFVLGIIKGVIRGVRLVFYNPSHTYLFYYDYNNKAVALFYRNYNTLKASLCPRFVSFFSLDLPLLSSSIRQAQICLIDCHKPTRKYIVFLWFYVAFCGFTKTLKSTCRADIIKRFLVVWYIVNNTCG